MKTVYFTNKKEKNNFLERTYDLEIKDNNKLLYSKDDAVDYIAKELHLDEVGSIYADKLRLHHESSDKELSNLDIISRLIRYGYHIQTSTATVKYGTIRLDKLLDMQTLLTAENYIKSLVL